MPPVRRLTAILAADVAGYSRLMGADEEGTHERLKSHVGELVNPKIEEHRGRIVKNTGDGFLAEFASVVDAVRCAAEVQRGMAERNEGAPPEKQIEFRVGINLGDVIAEGEDIFGDGVNVAARLEALAEPGGVLVSNTVYDHVRDRLPFAFEDLGEQQVKNIARPVRVFALGPETVAELPAAGTPIAVPPRFRPSIVGPVAAGIVAMLVIVTIAWWAWPTTKSSPTAPAAVAATTSVAQPFVAPRLSIVVLPFVNLSNDPDQQYFADGITDDLTTDLSRISDSFVISRGTAFTYRNKPVDAKQIGRELGVSYVLEGSVRRANNQVRVNVQLIDAATDAHLWAERFDRDMGDLFALQNEITNQIAREVGGKLIGTEAARSSEHPDALDYIFRGRAVSLKPASRENSAEAISLYERALALDPGSVEAQGLLAVSLAARVLNGMTSSADADIARAEGLVGQVLAKAPRSLLAHFTKGQVLRTQHRCEEAIAEFETVLASDRNYVDAIASLEWCKLLMGSIEEAIPLVEQIIRLSPRDPNLGNWYFRIAVVHLLQSRTDEAIIWLEKAHRAMPELPWPPAWLAAAYGLKGETERAAAELDAAQKLSPDHRFSSIARMRTLAYWGVPKIQALFETTYVAGLRKAGMPEE
jgi:TolB-like protein/class 3 adenylate cyclase